MQTEAEAKEFIDTVSNEFADATHNAWAYKIGFGDRSIRRSSDAGEPANTAGPPMLQAIEGQGLTNVVVVGTRYFGGVKLGVGGLIRAYRDTALAGLEAAGVREEVIKMCIRDSPGTGKTTLARVIANSSRMAFEQLSAVTAGVSDIRRVVAAAEERLGMNGQATILFIDEIHRFNNCLLYTSRCV